jgi:hypothetical protein
MSSDQRESEQNAYDAIVNGIAAAEAETNEAKMGLQQALAAGDYAAVADWQERIADARARAVNLSAGKDSFDAMDSGPVQPAPTAQSIIDSMNLMEEERGWARKLHPDWMTTQRGQELLRSAYMLTERAGYRRGSPEFLAQMEERLGLPSSANLGLTKQQLEHARWSNVSPETYAENARKLQALKARGYYTNN